jgi:CheY-like chemotaxis protein
MTWPGVRTFEFEIDDVPAPDPGTRIAHGTGVAAPPGAHYADAPGVPAEFQRADRAPAHAAVSPAPATMAVSEPAERRLRVLVVDDDDDIRQVVAFTLKALTVPVEVVEAVDGQEAVEMAETHPPDLVVLDIMMPRMDGFEACKKLRQNVRTAFVPILMLTASGDEMSRSKGFMVGTDDYVSKPFLPSDLKTRVTRLLRRTYGI